MSFLLANIYVFDIYVFENTYYTFLKGHWGWGGKLNLMTHFQFKITIVLMVTSLILTQHHLNACRLVSCHMVT